MRMFTLKEIDADIDALRACGYKQILEQGVPDVAAYRDGLARAAALANETGETQRAEALTLLAAACQPMLQPSKPYEPFGPLWKIGNRSSIVPSDFSEKQGKLLVMFGAEVADHELAARLADLGWVTTRKRDAALHAINSYIASSNSDYCQKMWVDGVYRLERALRIASQLQDSDMIAVVVGALSAILGCLETQGDDRSLAGAQYVGTLLVDEGRADAKMLAQRAQQWAATAESRGDYWGQSRHLEFSARAFQKATERDCSVAMRVAAAEALVRVADSEEQAGKKMVAHSRLCQAIGALQKCGGQKQRVEELQVRLSKLGGAALAEMRRIEVPVDVSDVAAQVQRAMRGRDVFESLMVFALIARPLEKKKLREQAQEQAAQFPLRSLFRKNRFNRNGRVVATVPPLLASKPKEQEEALEAATYEQAMGHQKIQVDAVILPALDELLRQHVINTEILEGLMGYSVLFPAGRESLWLKGFLAGFEGDFVVAISILIPQFEHALRKILEARGAVVFRQDSETGVQTEKLLGELLDMEGAETFLGKDLQFALQGLLTEREGANLRNEFAHGLLEETDFGAPAAVYVWWLLFHMAFMLSGITVNHPAAEQEKKGGEAEENIVGESSNPQVPHEFL